MMPQIHDHVHIRKLHDQIDKKGLRDFSHISFSSKVTAHFKFIALEVDFFILSFCLEISIKVVVFIADLVFDLPNSQAIIR